MARIDLSALNDHERERYFRQQAKKAVSRAFRLPPIVYVLVLVAGAAATVAPDLPTWGRLLGAAVACAGAYAMGGASAPGERAARDAARVDSLTDALVLIGFSGVDGRPDKARPEGAESTGQPVRRNARFPARRRPRLRAVPGGAAPGARADELDQPLPGEAALADGEA